MKIKYFQCTLLFFFIFTGYSIAQETTAPELPTTIRQLYDKDTKIFREGEVKDTLAFNKKMLNILFTKEISNYLTESSNLNTRKAYAVLSEEDNRLFLGGSFTNPFKKRNPIDRLIGLHTLGIKADIKDKFTTVFSSDELNNDLGISYKYTYIGRGVITYSTRDSKKAKNSDRKKVEEFRKKYLLDEFLELESKKSIETASQKQSKTDVVNQLEGKSVSKLKNQIPKSTVNELYQKVLEEEAETVVKQKWFTNYYNWWISLETFIPVTETEYKTSENITSNQINTSSYSPFEFEFSGNFFIKTAGWGSLQTRGILEGYNNNTIRAELTDEIKPFTFLEFQEQIDENQNEGNNTFFAQLDDNNVNVGEFREFFTTGLRGELVYFFPDKLWGKDFSFIGLSASYEKFFGDYDAENWRLGVPFVLKDKEGKATINFEVQWREINKEHTIGFSIGVPFGKFVK